MLRYLTVLLPLLTWPLSLQAAGGFLYDCSMKDFKQAHGWVSPRVAIVMKENGKVEVVDSLILHFEGGPVPGKVVRNNDQRMIVKWRLKNARADSGTSFGNFDYRASIAKKSGAIELTAIPSDFDTGVRSGGTCKIRRP